MRLRGCFHSFHEGREGTRRRLDVCADRCSAVVVSAQAITLARVAPRSCGRGSGDGLIGRVRRLLDSSYSDLPRVEHSALVPAIGLRRSSMRYGIMANAMNDSESSLSSPASEMKAQDVIEILRVFEHHGIEVHVDGGWAVDALLGQQTRPHADLDIAIQHKDAPLVRALLAAQGFREIPRDDSWECNVVLEDERGRQIDIHSYTFDAAGNHVYGVPYPLGFVMPVEYAIFEDKTE